MKDEILNNTELRELPIGPEEVAEAAAILQKYKAGKAALDLAREKNLGSDAVL